MRYSIAFACCLLAFLGASRFAGAEPPAPLYAGSHPADKPPPVQFAAGTNTFQLYGSYMHDVTNRNVLYGAGTLALGHYIMDDVSLNLELSGYGIDEPGYRTGAASAGLLLRQHFFHVGQGSAFLDVGGGVLEAGHDVPIHGTRFNFWMRTGPGILYPLREDLFLMAGAHFVHLSNAKIQGHDRNPSANGIEGFIGLMFRI